MAKYTTETYKIIAADKWGDRYDYSTINYINSYHKIQCRCIKHDELFEVSPIEFIRTTGHTKNHCRSCKTNCKLTHDEYMEKIQKYDTLYDLSKVVFKTTRENIILVCEEENHGAFEIEARHVSAKGIKPLCGKCIENNRCAPQQIIEKAENAVFYKIKVIHKPSKLEFLKIGITSFTTMQRYSSSQYRDFDFEIIEEVFETGLKVIELEKNYKRMNTSRRIFLPKNIKFSGRTECYILDDELLLKSNQVKIIRDGLIEKQNNICPLCTNEIKMPTLDHSHTKRHHGDGLIRGVLCNNCNRMIGVIENKASMNGIDFSDLPDFLRHCADFAEQKHYNLIHPSEAPKIKKLSKRNFNKLKKEYGLSGQKKKFPEFPKSGKLTVGLKALFEEFKIEPYN